MRTSSAICICFLVTLFFNGKAQTLRYGIKGGLTLSDVVINNTTSMPDAESDFRMRVGFHAGAFASYDLDNRTGLSAEVLYSLKGTNAITKVNLNYVAIPLLLRYALSEKFVAELGLELDYLIDATSQYGNLDATWNNQIDLGLDAGMQYYLSKRMVLGIRFNAGMSSVIQNKVDPLTGKNLSYENRALQFSLGYIIRKKVFQEN